MKKRDSRESPQQKTPHRRERNTAAKNEGRGRDFGARARRKADETTTVLVCVAGCFSFSFGVLACLLVRLVFTRSLFACPRLRGFCGLAGWCGISRMPRQQGPATLFLCSGSRSFLLPFSIPSFSSYPSAPPIPGSRLAAPRPFQTHEARNNVVVLLIRSKRPDSASFLLWNEEPHTTHPNHS